MKVLRTTVSHLDLKDHFRVDFRYVKRAISPTTQPLQIEVQCEIVTDRTNYSFISHCKVIFAS